MKLRHATLLFALLWGSEILGKDGEKSGTDDEPDYPHLLTTDGREYLDCFVRKSDAEGLLIEHRGGMAKISFFDLSPEIRDPYDFDPIAAMKMYRETRENDRLLRKERLLEAEKYRSKQAQEKAFEEMQRRAETDWIPIEASILSVQEDIAYARVKEVVYEPTTRISSLGFENPGPPRRVTRVFGEGFYFLRSPGPGFRRGSKWKGYMEPFPIDRKPHPSRKGKSVGVHLAVPPP